MASIGFAYILPLLCSNHLSDNRRNILQSARHDARAISIAIVERSSSIAQEVVGASSSSSS
eukprot:CAMPEP_0196154416 /NCGR_PEP_ID=MMETSP0910-20130528/38835_1 /TAXON_ID=49265 /ORGANISM="Thalassiosira rotula, Strain GSO102" /LENGTH=60 /DNA_ID=CAMNT_0041418423 /DNA_START=22 /DNA_END=201 /DNA_ORIENTATION=-